MKRPAFLSLRIHAVILLVVIFMTAIHTLPRGLAKRSPHLDLARSWSFCVVPGEARPSLDPAGLSQCAWTPVKGKIPPSLLHGNEWLVYRARFSAPEFCAGSATLCTLLIGTMSDPSEAYLNGAYVGRVGTAPPKISYSQTYPAAFPLVGLKPQNEMILLSRPINRTAHGMLRGPVAVFTAEGARTISEALVGETVVLPLISALFMLVFAVAGVFNLSKLGVNLHALHLFSAYALTMAFYLMSLTRIPREHLPLDVAYSVHFSLRLLSEFFLLGFIGSFLTTCRKTLRITRFIRGFYLSCAVGLLLLIPFGPALLGEMDSRIFWIYRLSVTAVDAFFLTYVIALPLAFRHRLTFPQFVPVFTVMALMQLWDILALNGLVEDIYFVRVYPVPVGLAFAWALWQSGWKARQQREIAAELGMVATQVAHDLRSPLAALKTAASSLSADRSDESVLVTAAVGRLEEISSSLLNRYQAGAVSKVSVSSLVEPLLREYRSVLKMSGKDRVRVTSRYEGESAKVEVSAAEFKRVLSNLLNNSIEALPESRGAVRVVVSGQGKEVRVSIEDTGKGIEDTRNLFVRGATQGKPGGNGFGLVFAKEALERWKGHVQVQSQVGRGTTVTMHLPRV